VPGRGGRGANANMSSTAPGLATPVILAAARRSGSSGSLRGMTLAARGFQEQGALRPGLTIARAADILWFYLGPWSYRVLVTERGWTLGEYEAWLADTLYSQVMSNG